MSHLPLALKTKCGESRQARTRDSTPTSGRLLQSSSVGGTSSRSSLKATHPEQVDRQTLTFYPQIPCKEQG
ncbi:hypothetical protein TNCT_41691 [Trichonephila clavata]|uniref:Uncharacterized protein n=1 Tax=Trichonephila clavata TaxID=2740835 RepID=A0A8X6JG94_TRICU|nr:hypothetical protein TNCT_41691 [Trichonephila clavata]